jgi:hypothetical protein
MFVSSFIKEHAMRVRSAMGSRRVAVFCFAAGALLFSMGMAVDNYSAASSTRSVSVAEAQTLFGATCDKWDDDGDGCSVGGCGASCKTYSKSDDNNYDKSGAISDTNCAGQNGSCGTFENVDQSQCSTSGSGS